MPTPATCSSASPCLVLAPRLLRSQPQRTGLSPRGRPGAWLARDRALVRWQACSTRLWAVDQQPHQPPPRRVLVCALMTAASHGRVPRGHTRSLNGQPDRVTACNLQVRGAPPGVSAKSAAKPVRVCVRRWWVAGGGRGRTLPTAPRSPRPWRCRRCAWASELLLPENRMCSDSPCCGGWRSSKLARRSLAGRHPVEAQYRGYPRPSTSQLALSVVPAAATAARWRGGRDRTRKLHGPGTLQQGRGAGVHALRCAMAHHLQALRSRACGS